MYTHCTVLYTHIYQIISKQNHWIWTCWIQKIIRKCPSVHMPCSLLCPRPWSRPLPHMAAHPSSPNTGVSPGWDLKIFWKGMITRDSPISGNLHMPKWNNMEFLEPQVAVSWINLPIWAWRNIAASIFGHFPLFQWTKGRNKPWSKMKDSSGEANPGLQVVRLHSTVKICCRTLLRCAGEQQGFQETGEKPWS